MVGPWVLTNSSSHGYYLTAISLCEKPSGSVEDSDELFLDGTENEQFIAFIQNECMQDIECAASQHNSNSLAKYRWEGCMDE